MLSTSFSGLPGRVTAQETGGGPFLPIGGGYSDIYAGFSAAAVANARDGQVTILVLPAPYSSNADSITEAERGTNLRDAEERRFQIEEACKRAAPAGIICRAIIAPIFTRSDAADPIALAPLANPLSAIFILGGDQTVAMQALAGTPAEEALAKAHAAGAVVAGTSAGGAVQSVTMLGGYQPNFAAANSLDFGAPEIWNGPEKRGLVFGLQDVIVDQHFFQRGRMGRLLNALAMPDTPAIGIGVDAYTGVVVRDRTQVGDVFGLYAVAVLDEDTYHAADGVGYVAVPGAPARPPVLSLRNVLVHLLASGGSVYDLATRTHSLGAPAPRLERTFAALRVPEGAGTLLLAGDLSQSLSSHPALARFLEQAGKTDARVLIYADGFPSTRSAQSAAGAVAAALGTPSEIYLAGEGELPSLSGFTGAVVIGRDQSRFDAQRLAAWLRDPWLAGLPVLADNAGAVALGAFYSAHEPTPNEDEEAEFATQRAFRQGETVIQPGAALLDVMLEPQLLNDNRWGRLFSLAYTHPGQIALGLTRDTALAITPAGAEVLGSNVLFVLDLRTAKLGLGSNGVFEIANGLLDVFGPGERVAPTVADRAAMPERQPTPSIPQPTPLAAVESALTPGLPAAATAVPTPTPTPSPAAATTGINPILFLATGLLVGLAAIWIGIRRFGSP